MAIDLAKIKGKLNSLQSGSRRQKFLWKPTKDHVIRLLPYKYDPENPFVQLYFHFDINKRTYLSPVSFNKPDPFVEFCEKLKATGDPDNKILAKKYEPVLKIYCPILVRGQEAEGVKIWGFSKKVFADIVGIMDDPDYADIVDIEKGRDISVKFKPASETGTNYSGVEVRPKPNITPAVDPKSTKYDPKAVMDAIDNQPNIPELFDIKTYEELKLIFTAWLNPQAADEADPADDPVNNGEDDNNSGGGNITKEPTSTLALKPAAEKMLSAKTEKITDELVEQTFDSVFDKI